jgi:hypothetical protein
MKMTHNGQAVDPLDYLNYNEWLKTKLNAIIKK